MAILAIQVILVVALAGQLTYGQDCTILQIAGFVSQLDSTCQGNLAILQLLQVRTEADLVAGTEVTLTPLENAALAAACIDSCIGSLVDTLEDECSQEQAVGLASLCIRRTTDNQFCIQVNSYILSRVEEAIDECNGSMTCPTNCSTLLPVLYGNGGCCIKTPLPFAPAFTPVITMFCEYFELCGMTNLAACPTPYIGAGTTVFIAKTLLAITIFIATFLNIV